jgi:mycofactocin radical SAM maturase
VKFSTNGALIDETKAKRLADMDYVDVQISLDGAKAVNNDRIRGSGSYRWARQAMEHLASAGFEGFKISVVMTRHNVPDLDEFRRIAESYGAQLRITRFRPSGRGAVTWRKLRPTLAQQRTIYEWLRAHPQVLTGDSFFHLSALGEPLEGLNLCGAGRVVCLIDPVGDVYACPFALHPEFHGGSILESGGFSKVWSDSIRFRELREPSEPQGACSSCDAQSACQGGCMAAKFFTGLALEGPDPECVRGHGEDQLATVSPSDLPPPGPDHSKRAGLRRLPKPASAGDIQTEAGSAGRLRVSRQRRP